MDGYAVSSCYESDDIVSRKRRAALRKLYNAVINAVNNNSGVCFSAVCIGGVVYKLTVLSVCRLNILFGILLLKPRMIFESTTPP